MPYEYELYAHTAKTVGKENLQEWLCEMGAKNWRLVSFDAEIDQPIIFERKIEASPKLRNIQLGKEIAKDDGKNTETKGD